MLVEFQKQGLHAEAQVPVTVLYHGVDVGLFRPDILVEGRVIVEVKAAEQLAPAHDRQLLTYLRATRLEVGLLLNFGPRARFRRFIYTNDRK